MPMVQNPKKELEVGKPAWWANNAYAYGRGTTPISIAVLTNDNKDFASEIKKPNEQAICGVAVQQSTKDDVGILLGVPAQAVPPAPNQAANP